MLSCVAPPPEPPVGESFDLLLLCGEAAPPPPPLGPPALVIGIPTLGNPAGLTMPDIVGPLSPPPL
jgi:hypothetical protein